MKFEGFDGQTTAPASGDVFTNRNPNGPIDEKAATGSGALPPGANVFRVNKRAGASTPASFIRKIGD